MPQFRVVDVRSEHPGEQLIDAHSPEKAAMTGLQLNLTRSGVKRNLVCRVYWRDGESTMLNMVRLYSRVS